MKRRLFIASSLASLGLAGCTTGIKDKLTSGPLRAAFDATDSLDHGVIGTRGMAKLYADADINREFRTNGNDTPQSALYTGLVREAWSGYRLVIDGRVERPQSLSVAALRAMPLQTQITRHDCVEGWSAIGKWRGVRLADVLALAQPKSDARYAVFSCFDSDQLGTHYYESLDLHEARHPQTLLALDLNDKPLDPDHGAPVRMRIPTQLGYKSAKWVQHIALVPSFAAIGQGAGGYWEDQGYDWYAGI